MPIKIVGNFSPNIVKLHIAGRSLEAFADICTGLGITGRAYYTKDVPECYEYGKYDLNITVEFYSSFYNPKSEGDLLNDALKVAQECCKEHLTTTFHIETKYSITTYNYVRD